MGGGGGGSAGAEVRELASHQCRLGLIPGLEVIKIEFVVGSLCSWELRCFFPLPLSVVQCHPLFINKVDLIYLMAGCR